MGIIELLYNNVLITDKKQILNTIKKCNLSWLIDCELDNASIEIINNVIIWNGGNFMNGDSKFMIFKKGIFQGNWINGIWEGGSFQGKWSDERNEKPASI